MLYVHPVKILVKCNCWPSLCFHNQAAAQPRENQVCFRCTLKTVNDSLKRTKASFVKQDVSKMCSYLYTYSVIRWGVILGIFSKILPYLWGIKEQSFAVFCINMIWSSPSPKYNQLLKHNHNLGSDGGKVTPHQPNLVKKTRMDASSIVIHHYFYWESTSAKINVVFTKWGE